jgi:AcrR family transcriptional regulator
VSARRSDRKSRVRSGSARSGKARPDRARSTNSRSDLGPLPGGHHGLSREQVAESQRERLLAGLAHAVAEHGYRATTITEIVKAASVSSRAFYENFDSKEDCFLAAFDAVLAHLEALIAEAVEPQPDWPQKVIAALGSALRFFAAEPDLARLCLIEPITASPTIATRFRAAVVSCIPYLQPGRVERADGESLPESTEDSLLGGLIVLTARSLLAAEPSSLEDLLPDLVDFALAPYLGPKQAKELAAQAAA